MWILGMPFFRHYYTTFDTAPKRALHMAAATDACEPSGEAKAASTSPNYTLLFARFAYFVTMLLEGVDRVRLLR